MDTSNGLPAGWMENEHGVFWRKTSQGAWFDMETAPLTGAPFVWLRPTFIVGPGHKRRVEMDVTVLHRKNYDCSSGGYWYSASCSVADDHARHGWWSHSARLTQDGRLVMPHAALDYIRERTKRLVA